MRPWLHRLQEARRQSPELADLMVALHRNEMAIREWQQQYQASEHADRPAMLDEARRLARQRVDLRLQQDRLRVQMLKQRLHDLEETLGKRQASQEALVEREMARMQAPPPDPTVATDQE